MNSGEMLEEIGAATAGSAKSGFAVGDNVVVHYTIHEGDKTVVQKFKGVLIADKGRGVNQSITVRHITGGIGVERVFPLNSPIIEKIEVIRRGEVRRAKLYYIRDRKGKAATQVKEKRFAPEATKGK